MKFNVVKASNWEFQEQKIFHTIDQIYEYLKKVDTSGRMSVVIYFTENKEDEQELWIYDSYIE